MRFLQFMIVSFAVFTTALFGSCTSKEGSGEEPESPTTTSYKVRVKVSTGEYTRAGDDAAVNTLHLAFFTGATLNGVVKAEKETDGTFQCDLPEGTKPNGVIAFANLSDTQAQAITEDNIMTLNYSDLENSDGTMIMSSARYFDDGRDMLKTPLTIANLIQDGSVIEIPMERLASKVSVSQKNSSFEQIPVVYQGSTTYSLSLTIDSWGITATEKSTYLIKQLGTFSQLKQGELEGWDEEEWNHTDKKFISWAHSLSWDNGSKNYPTYALQEGMSYPLNYATLGECIFKMADSKYCQESTTPKSLYKTDNALASIVLRGQYTNSAIAGTRTFYIERKDGKYNLHSESTLKRNLASRQNLIYMDENKENKATNEVGYVLEHPSWAQSVPQNYVTLQLSSSIANNLNLYYDENGNSWNGTEVEVINKALAEECGYAEIFQDGKCYFIVPIRNAISVVDPDNTTGSYGLVRNHYYDITINSISGLGTGIASEDCVPLKYTYSGQSSSAYKVNANVSVNEWQNVNQTVDIPKN